MYRKAAVAVGLSAVLAGGLATTAGGQGDQRVNVRMSEFEFRAPDSFPKGRTRITFRNVGEFNHNFTIVDTYGRARRFQSATLEGGQRQTRTFNLRPGVYVAVCTVFEGRHVANGMVTRFTVGQQREDGSWE